jgi:hypothetical protein
VLGSILMWWRRQRLLALRATPRSMAGGGHRSQPERENGAIDRPRPNLDPWGFPSAHVLTMVVLAGFIAYVIGTFERAAARPGAGHRVLRHRRRYRGREPHVPRAHWPVRRPRRGRASAVRICWPPSGSSSRFPPGAISEANCNPMAANGPSATSMRFLRRSE